MESWLVGDIFVVHSQNRRYIAEQKAWDYRIPKGKYVNAWWVLVVTLTSILGFTSLACSLVFIPQYPLNQITAFVVIASLCCLPIWYVRREESFKHGQLLTGKLVFAEVYFRRQKWGHKWYLRVGYEFLSPNGQKLSRVESARRRDFRYITLPAESAEFSLNNLLYAATNKRQFLQQEINRVIEMRHPNVNVLYVNDGLFRVL